jgi:amino acid adenylation domain-containing protein
VSGSPRGVGVRELVEKAFRDFPCSTAISWRDREVTYETLERASDGLARALRAAGISPGGIVTVVLKERIDVVAALLAILRARCVFVPLDSDAPEEHLQLTSEALSADAVITDQELSPLAKRVFHGTAAAPITLLFDWKGTDDPKCDRLDSERARAELDPGLTRAAGEPDDVCYIYFTSGSTGRPKGIAGTVKGLSHFIEWETRYFGIDGGWRFSQFTAPTFDAFLRDVLVPLCAGGQVCIPPEADTLLDPRALLDWIDSRGIHLIHCVPTLFSSVVRALPVSHRLESLRLVLMSGEVLPVTDVKKWSASFGERIGLVNLYGPTETTMVKFCYLVQRSDVDRGFIPIGKPIEGARAVILDEAGKPCPPGVAGEIHIRTPYRTRGYYKQPELTAQVFVQNPFNDDPDDLIYKTGDLGRRLQDGNFQFVGRRDGQVKVRGVRIELGEIEAALRGHPAVQEAAVLAREDRPGDKSLVAYVVARGENHLTTSELRRFLQGKLPDYFLPTVFVTLSSFPLTASGKIDRRSLPAPDRSRPELEKPYVAPRSTTERALVEIWTEVLSVERVGVEDNFFELGGHSLLATQVISRLRHQFQVELPLRELFEEPTVANLARVIDRARSGEWAAPGPPIVPASREGDLPLSFSQQRLWFLDQLMPGNPFYNMPSAVRLVGRFDQKALLRTMTEIVRRHEALRTTFSTVQGRPVQIIAPGATVDLPVVDVSAIPPAAREREVSRLGNAEARLPFDLTRGPLLRWTVLRLEEEEHVFLFTMHHIVSDAWSLGVLVGEVAALYSAFVEGRPSPLHELTAQYADFAIWQRQWLQGEVLQEQLSYWRRRLAGVPPLELPTDRPRFSAQSFRGATHTFAVDAGVADSLRALCEREGVTSFMALLAVFQLLLSRYSGQQDIAVGTSIANRNRAEIEPLIGFFLNMLVMRTDLSGNPTFRELLGRVREVALGAYAHQDLPFEKLVEELQPQRDLSREALVQVLFVMHNAPVRVLQMPHGLTLRPVETERGTAKFDLSLFATEGNDGIYFRMTYQVDVFEASTISRLADHFRLLLQQVAADPDKRISDFSISSASDEEARPSLAAALVEAAPPRLGELLDRAFARHSAKAAMEWRDRKVSYGALDRAASQLAHALLESGLSKGSLVAVLLDGRIDIVVALLGALRAGCAFVPLDVSSPDERLRRILSHLRPQGLITSEARGALARRLFDGSASSRIVLDWQGEGDRLRGTSLPALKPLETMSTDRPSSNAGPEDIAYVYYTSGSTGAPKGIAGSLKGLSHFIDWEMGRLEIAPGWRFSQLTAPTFDAFLRDVLVPLASGGTICVPPEEDVLLDPHQLLAWLDESEISLVHCVPTLFSSMVSVLPAPQRLESLRYILMSGEVLPVNDVRRWMDAYGERVQLVNLYGPTETTLVKFCHFVQPSDVGRGFIPIGRPIEGARAVILDEAMKICPRGTAGEIYIRTPYRTLGYHRDPELTREVFLPSPFSSDPEDRIYRTGDLGRVTSDGNYQFLGRKDEQIKIRGARVELGEVEAALREHPSVEHAAVAAREDLPGLKSLVGYVVPAEGTKCSTSELHRFLKTKLPDHLIPSAFVTLDALPLRPSGKVDRRALPAPARARPDLEKPYLSPRTPTEMALADIWSEVLRLDQIGLQDNFFELGGHSLLATQVISRLRERFELEVPLRALFEEPTVMGLAEAVERARRGGMPATMAPIPRAARDAELPLSFGQQRLWFLDQLVPGGAFYNIPTGVRLSGRLDVPALRRCLAEVVRRHDSLRTTFGSEDGRPVQRIAAEAKISLPELDLSALGEGAREQESRRVGREEARRPFDLARGPLFRALLTRLGEDDYSVLFNMHHIVSDAWSIRILVQEISALYATFINGLPSPLPELPVQYADFAVWQRSWFQGNVLGEQLEYWRKQLDGLTPLQLPTDRSHPLVPTFRGARHDFVIPENVVSAVSELSRREGVTRFMTLLAAFQALLARYSEKDDISVGSPIAGRNRTEVEGVIGFFVNTLVLRSDLSGDPVFHDLLERVRRVALGAYAHQDLPFEKLVEELHPDRDMRREPLFQVVLSLQNVPTRQHVVPTGIRQPGLRLRGMELERTTARFDLTLFLWEEPRGLRASAEYSTDLFDEVTIIRMMRHFEHLLAAFLAAPARPISEAGLLDPEERHQILMEWNPGTSAYPATATIPSLFEEQAARAPERVAVVSGDQHLTFAELRDRAHRLAHHLRSLGVGADRLVAICMHRSPTMVVGLLGILEAGGAYLPLDPGYPTQRLSHMVEDSGVSVLLTTEPLLPRLEVENTRIVCLDRDWELIGRHPAERPSGGFPDQIAYAIYTSGSTGRPKGVLGTHRGAVNRFTWMWRTYPFEDADVACQKTSLGFLDSLWEIFGNLLQGVRLVILSDEVVADPRRLAQELIEERVSRIVLVPSLLRVILERGDLSEQIRGMKLWVTSGEALSVDLANEFRRQLPRATMLNLYGSSEVTADVTCFEVGATRSLSSIPIGRPIANTVAHLLDRTGGIAPVGIPGELLVGGEGLARGYLSRPELTAERFVPNAQDELPGARLYRTGDRARYRHDGSVEYLGRSDQQIKIRGFRIELGEIEAVLREHPLVSRVVLVDRRDRAGERRLVAYYVAAPGAAAPEAAELRNHLRARVPEYMVPTSFEQLLELPLTPSGKLDRTRLPDPEWNRGESEDGYVPPSTPVEEELVRIWSELLRVDRIGIHDGFFELGGHSLLAVQLAARIEQSFGFALPLRTLFSHGTIEKLAAVLERRGGDTLDLPLVMIRAGDEKPPFFCVHPGGGHPQCYEGLARELAWEGAFIGLQARGVEGEAPPLQTVEEQASHYVRAVRKIQPEGPYFLAGWSTGGLVAFEMAQQLAEEGEKTALLALFDTRARFTRREPFRGEDGPRRFARHLHMQSELFEFDVPFSVDELARYQPHEQIEQLRRHYSLTSPALAEALARRAHLYLEISEINVRASYDYQPKRYPGTITLFLARRRSPKTARRMVEEWTQLSSVPLDIQRAPGSHLTMMSARPVRGLAKRLRECLERRLATG